MVERTQNTAGVKSSRWRWPLFWSGLILLSQAFPLAAPVRDAATLLPLPQFHLHFPFWHLVFTPFCSVADALTVLGAQEEKVLIVTVFILGFLLAGFRRGILSFLLFTAFVAWGVLVPRPMGRLIASDPNVLLIDFHSHTQFSHDGRKSFAPELNMRWHEQQGYNAAFITDHNLVEGAVRAKNASEADWKQTGYRSLEGEEVSLKKTHLVILGNRQKIDNVPFDLNGLKIHEFVTAMHQLQLPVIASLPEYWLYHWTEAGYGSYQDFAAWGMDGFEIINSAPKAQDFPLAYRSKIVDLCRAYNLFMTGISDNHGYGYATAAWNAMRIPGWQSLAPDALEKAVIQQLGVERFQAIQVLERVRYIPTTTFQLLISPWATLWLYWRALALLQCFSWVAWIWLLHLVKALA